MNENKWIHNPSLAGGIAEFEHNTEVLRDCLITVIEIQQEQEVRLQALESRLANANTELFGPNQSDFQKRDNMLNKVERARQERIKENETYTSRHRAYNGKDDYAEWSHLNEAW